MKKTISKDSIILIALIYNYLANYEIELAEWKIPGYIEAIKNRLKKINSEWEIVDECPPEEKYELNKYYEKNKINKTYKLYNLNNLESWYLKQPKEIIHVSLDEFILPTIYSEQLRYIVPIIEEYEPYKGYREVSCTEENSAKFHLTRILEYELAKNIVIEKVEPIPRDDKKGYNVYYTCDRFLERIDLSVIQNKIKKLTEKMDLLKLERTKLQEERKELSNEKVSTKKGILFGAGLCGTILVSSIILPSQPFLSTLIGMIYVIGVPATYGSKEITKDKELLEEIKKLSNQIDEIDVTINGKKEPYHYIKDTNSYLIEENTIVNVNKTQQSNTQMSRISTNQEFENKSDEVLSRETSTPLTRRRKKD